MSILTVEIGHDDAGFRFPTFADIGRLITGFHVGNAFHQHGAGSGQKILVVMNAEKALGETRTAVFSEITCGQIFAAQDRQVIAKQKSEPFGHDYPPR